MGLTINSDDLAKGAKTLSKQLLLTATHRLRDLNKYLTVIPGIQSSINIAELFAQNIELAPYKASRRSELEATIINRNLDVYLGSSDYTFDPNLYYRSAYGMLQTKGIALTKGNLIATMMTLLSKTVSDKLYEHLWDAKRKDDGDLTKDLFNGFDTLTQTELTAGNLSAAKENYAPIGAITELNAVDKFKDFVESADDKLLDQPNLGLYVSTKQYNSYCRAYQSEHGSLPYNNEYRKVTVESGAGDITLIKMPNKTGSNFIQLAPKSVMVVGLDNQSNDEKVIVEKHSVFNLDFAMTLRLGCQIATLDKTYFKVADTAVEPS